MLSSEKNLQKYSYARSTRKSCFRRPYPYENKPFEHRDFLRILEVSPWNGQEVTLLNIGNVPLT